MDFNLPHNIEEILSVLNLAGYEAYIVGGCVRDLLSHRTPHDFDITTSALPQQVEALFEHTVKTGIKHGTVTVISDGTPVEVTTFRTESGYSDNRRPDKVDFVNDVKLDLARRDFTINAMCYSKKTGLIDCFGGKEDLKNGILRTVGNPYLRFEEDALRILRLFRFASTLGFTIESATLKAALDRGVLLNNVSAERVFTELYKTAQGKNPLILNRMLPTGCMNKYRLGEITPCDIDSLSGGDLRFFALLYNSSDNIAETLTLLKCSNKLKQYCLNMKYLCSLELKSDIDIKRALCSAESEFPDFLQYADKIFNRDTEMIRLSARRIADRGEPYKISQLKITGDDLTACGISGRQVGEKLKLLLEAVMEDPSLNRKDILINLICN